MKTKPPPTDDELAEMEVSFQWEAERAGDLEPPFVSAKLALNLVAEVRRLREIAGCRGCLAGYRLGDDHLHYDDARGGATWGVCERWAARVTREEAARLRALRDRSRG